MHAAARLYVKSIAKGRSSHCPSLIYIRHDVPTPANIFALRMKLHLVQRWAYKLGIPRSILNGFAQEYYGHAIPNAEGKYPDWWYVEQGVPATFRDCEVPKEVLKKEGKKKNRRTLSPKVYVRVAHGRIVEIVSNGPALQSAPDLHQQPSNYQTGRPQAVITRERYEIHRADSRAGADTPEIVTHHVQMRSTNSGTQTLHRITSMPSIPRATSPNEDDVMSFIRSEVLNPDTRHPMMPGMVDPEALFDDTTSVRSPFVHTQRYATAPMPQTYRDPMGDSTPPLRSSPAQKIPANPRPGRHQRLHTKITEDNVLGNHNTSAAGNPPPTVPYSRRGRQFTRMDSVREDEMSEWSGYADTDAWEEEEMERRRAYGRAATDRLREYRNEN